MNEDGFEAIRWTLYDKLVPRVAQASYPMFAEPVSSIKGYNETNMHCEARLPTPQWFEAKAISFGFSKNVETEQFREVGDFQLEVGDKIYATLPLLPRQRLYLTQATILTGQYFQGRVTVGRSRQYKNVWMYALLHGVLHVPQL